MQVDKLILYKCKLTSKSVNQSITTSIMHGPRGENTIQYGHKDPVYTHRIVQ